MRLKTFLLRTEVPGFFKKSSSFIRDKQKEKNCHLTERWHSDVPIHSTSAMNCKPRAMKQKNYLLLSLPDDAMMKKIMEAISRVYRRGLVGSSMLAAC